MLCTLIIWCWKQPFVLFLSSMNKIFFPADPVHKRNWSKNKKYQLKLHLNKMEAKVKHFSEVTKVGSSAIW